mgnify:CR=1 FL=1
MNRNEIKEYVDQVYKKQIDGIAKIQLASLARRLSERELSISVSDSAIEKISIAGFDVIYGARPLKRAIQQMLENPLSHKLLSGDFVPGDTIIVDVNDHGDLQFSKQ